MASKRFGLAALVNEFECFIQVIHEKFVEFDLFEVLGKNVTNDTLFLPTVHALRKLTSKESLVKVPDGLEMSEKFDAHVWRKC